MVDLRTNYLGLELEHPVMASASPLSKTLDGIRQLEDGGASAVVLFSLFEEQLTHDAAASEHLALAGSESFGEALSYFPALSRYHAGPDAYLDLIRRASEATRIPIIGSLNGTTSEGWTQYARLIQQAGAKALELNVYFIPADLMLSGREVEERTLEAVRSVRSAVSIPISVKLSPFWSAVGEMSRRIVEAGAQGLALFNRFYQPDFDLDSLEVEPSLELSQPREIRLPLLWIAILHGRLQASLAATTGVETEKEVVKYLLAGADVVMSASSLLRHGSKHPGALRRGLEQWMDKRGYSSVRQMKGSMSQKKVADPSAFERANYIKVLQSYT